MTLQANQPKALEVAQAAALRLEAEGAEAVFFSGSHVRGAASIDSDIDLYALGAGPEYLLERAEPFLLSISWTTPDRIRAALRDPLRCAGVVPGLRRALLLHDPNGIAAALQAEARAWTWELLDPVAIDSAVAEELYGYAEEVQKLVANLRRGRIRVALVQRSVLALRLARIMAAYRRLLYEAEDDLWDDVARRIGPDWERAQAAALGEHGESPEESCRAALDLFALAAAELEACFNERQRAVVRHALARAATLAER